MVNIIDILRSSIKCVRSNYKGYSHNTFEVLSYCIVNYSEIQSHIGYTQLVL